MGGGCQSITTAIVRRKCTPPNNCYNREGGRLDDKNMRECTTLALASQLSKVLLHSHTSPSLPLSISLPLSLSHFLSLHCLTCSLSQAISHCQAPSFFFFTSLAVCEHAAYFITRGAFDSTCWARPLCHVCAKGSLMKDFSIN